MIKLNYFSKALIIIQCQDRSNPYVTGNMGSYNETEMNFFNLPNYTMVYDDSRLSKHGGLITYIHNSLSARILHRAPPPPAPSGPKFSNSENCCGSENAMPPKIFWDMEGHRGNFRSKNVFFFQKTYFGKKS